ncbi:transcriptional regulator [Streptomyces sp. NPDC052192]|uniref:transcriptional regulator n=1 Tax=Streptomyces sp. NPDC052192 TaxID=3155052 RepID=UPI00342C623B
MTTVRTPPPPRLPVRDRAPSTEAGGVSPMLGRLAAERATGVLIRERGTLYLADGEVVHAESPFTPGIDVLFSARGVLDPEVWREAVALAGARRRVGRFLIDSGRIAEGALQLCHLGSLYDAAYFVLGPSSTPSRFRYGAAHWFGTLRPVPVAALERETVRRRELLHHIWPDAATDTAPLRRAGLAAGPAVPLRQEAVLGRVDGVRTAADVSAALGRPAFHTLVDLRRLAAAGLVTAAPAARPPSVPGVLTQSSNDPDVALLRRLRDALEAL